MEIKVDVLECSSGTSKKGNAYNILVLRYPSGNGRIVKVFSDIAIEAGIDIDVEVDLAPNQDMFMTPRVKEVVK